MRSTSLVQIAALAVAFAALLPSSATAQDQVPERPGKLRFGVRTSIVDYRTTRLESDFGDAETSRRTRFAPLNGGLGFQLHYVVSPGFSLGFGPAISVIREPGGEFEGDITLISYALPFEAEFINTSGRRRPYANFGIGPAGETFRFFDSETTSLGFIARFAVGIHAFVGQRVSIDPEVFVTYLRSSDSTFESLTQQSVTVGLALSISAWVGGSDAPATTQPVPPQPQPPVPQPRPEPERENEPAASPFG
ncbi:MAG: hypothetical protein AAGH15_18600 [Myxococcota bacterium]